MRCFVFNLYLFFSTVNPFGNTNNDINLWQEKLSPPSGMKIEAACSWKEAGRKWTRVTGMDYRMHAYVTTISAKHIY